MAPLESTVVFRYGFEEPSVGERPAGRPAAGMLTQPRGIHTCADGTLLVADFARHCVVRFQPRKAIGKVVAGEDGKMLPTVDPLKDIDRPLGAPEDEGFLLKQPGDVAEALDGSILVLDTEAGRVQRFSSGAGVTIVPASGSASQKSSSTPEAIKNPRGLQCCADGAVIICDSWSHRVLRFDAASSEPQLLAGTANSTGGRPEQLCFPTSAVLSPDGVLFVADTNNHRVQRFEPGQLVGTTVAGSADCKAGCDLASLNMPTGLCLGESGSIFVADRMNARVLRFAANSRSGDCGRVMAGPELVERPWGVCIGKDGSLFVSDERQGVVLQLEVPADGSQSAPRDAMETTGCADDPMGLD